MSLGDVDVSSLSSLTRGLSPLYCDTRGCQELTKWHRSVAGSEGVTFAANYMLRVRDREREKEGERERVGEVKKERERKRE